MGKQLSLPLARRKSKQERIGYDSLRLEVKNLSFARFDVFFTNFVFLMELSLSLVCSLALTLISGRSSLNTVIL